MLTHDEKGLGVALVDIGGGTTDLAIFEGGASATRRHPIGGDHFTNDIAVGLRTPMAEAEVRSSYGCALSTLVDDDETIEVAGVGGRKPRSSSRHDPVRDLQPRTEEIFHLRQGGDRRRAGYEQLTSGVVLTGGGAIPRDARNRRADLRPAGQARHAARRRRSHRSRQQSHLFATVVGACVPRGRTARFRTRTRSRLMRASVAWSQLSRRGSRRGLF